MTNAQLENEINEMMHLLHARTVKHVWRHRPNEIALAFTDGTRLFVNTTGDMDISITGPDVESSPDVATRDKRMSPKTIAGMVLSIAIAWQIYLVTLLLRTAPTMKQLAANIGAELSLVTATFLNYYAWSPLVPVVSALLAADLFRRRRAGSTHAIVVCIVVATLGFALHAWATEACFRPMFELIQAVG